MDLPNGKPPEREVKYTFWLVFSVFICVFGNSFLYGYNIGVVNLPASLIKVFYAQVNYGRDGQETYYKHSTGGLYFKNPPNKTVSSANATVTTTIAYVMEQNRIEQMTNYCTMTDVCPAAQSYSSNNTEEANLAISKKGIEDDYQLEFLWSVTVVIFSLFGIIGSFSSGKVADYFGRKKGMIIITFLMFLAAVFGGIPILAKSPACLIISRIFAGLHCGLGTSLASLYLAEISPKKIRGAIGTCHPLFITIGTLCSMVMGLPKLLGTWNNWPMLFVFNAVPALTCLLLMPICPESPRYLLIETNDEDGARKALKSLLGYDDIDSELEEMRVEVSKAFSVQSLSLFKKLLTTQGMTVAMVIVTDLRFIQELPLITIAVSYSSFIFQQVNVPEDTIPYFVVLQGAINVLATIIAEIVRKKLDDKVLYIGFACLIPYIVFSVCFALQPFISLTAQNTIAIICIVAIFVCIIGYKTCQEPMLSKLVETILCEESHPATIVISSVWNWICNFTLMLSFLFIQKAIGAYTYLVFFLIFLASIVFCCFSVRKMKNRTYDDTGSISFGTTNIGENDPTEDVQEIEPMRTEKA